MALLEQLRRQTVYGQLDIACVYVGKAKSRNPHLIFDTDSPSNDIFSVYRMIGSVPDGKTDAREVPFYWSNSRNRQMEGSILYEVTENPLGNEPATIRGTYTYLTPIDFYLSHITVGTQVVLVEMLGFDMQLVASHFAAP